MRKFEVLLLLAVGASCAPPLEPQPTTVASTVITAAITEATTETALETTTEIRRTTATETTTEAALLEVTAPSQTVNADEIGHKTTTETVITTSTVPEKVDKEPPIEEEKNLNENQEMFELSPWQRLSSEQQKLFNEKYKSLSPVLQAYSRSKFLSLPVDRQEHAYAAFLTFDQETLAEVIKEELNREQNAEKQKQLKEERERERLLQERENQRRRNFQQRQKLSFAEQPRSQFGNRANNFNFNQLDNFRRQPPQSRQQLQQLQQMQQSNFKASRIPQQNQFLPQSEVQQQFHRKLSSAELLHFQHAEAQLQEAIRLQGCLIDPSTCRV